MSLFADDHSDGVERDQNVVLNPLFADFEQLALVVAAVPRICLAFRTARRVPDAYRRLVALLTAKKLVNTRQRVN